MKNCCDISKIWSTPTFNQIYINAKRLCTKQERTKPRFALNNFFNSYEILICFYLSFISEFSAKSGICL